jgi:hypothetical protein
MPEDTSSSSANIQFKKNVVGGCDIRYTMQAIPESEVEKGSSFVSSVSIGSGIAGISGSGTHSAVSGTNNKSSKNNSNSTKLEAIIDDSGWTANIVWLYTVFVFTR